MSEQRIILPIKPQTWVRIKSGKGGDQVFFWIPEECIKGNEEKDGPCLDYIQTGNCKHILSKSGKARKRRLERYNQYRLDLFHLAKSAGFMLPSCGWSLYFYLPVAKSWNKTKKAAMHGQLHMGKPDESNLLKAFEDALSIMDEQVAQMSGLGKFWIYHELLPDHLKALIKPDGGYIEILLDQKLYNPFGVEFTEQYRKISMEDIEVRRDRNRARKADLKQESIRKSGF